jgi:proteasome lid subunit RPN8/RPN11
MQDAPDEITFTSRQLGELERLAKDSLPAESCAFLLGRDSAIEEILPMKNADASRVSFTIPPDEILAAYRLAESKELHVAGIFHSHPSAPAPSMTDRRFMEINPVVWVIYSTTQEKFGAWIFADRVRKVGIKVRE